MFFLLLFSVDETKARSDTFAEKNGLQKYEYVLHPRTTGFTFIVDRLRDGNACSDALLFKIMYFR